MPSEKVQSANKAHKLSHKNSPAKFWANIYSELLGNSENVQEKF